MQGKNPMNKEQNIKKTPRVFCAYNISTWALRFYLYALKEGRIVRYDENDVLDSLLVSIIGYDITKHKKSSIKSFTNQLQTILKQIESKTEEEKCIVNENIEKLAKLIGLNTIEQKIIQLAVAIQNEDALRQLFYTPRGLCDYQALTYIAFILNVSYEEVSSALSIKGKLLKSGLLNRHSASIIEGYLDLTSGLVRQLLIPNIQASDLLKSYLMQAQTTKLKISDFYYIQPNIQLFIDYLALCFDTKRQGVNILLYGSPGTGKTELSKIISTELNCILYEVANENDDRPLSGTERFAFYRMSQYLAQDQRAIILFDEIEDVFRIERFSYRQPVSLSKALVNQTLETNPVPAIWISNNIKVLDDAYLRRFDLVYEIKIPPVETRKKIIQGYFKNTSISQSLINKLAAHKNLSPALVANTASIAKLISTSTNTTIEDGIESVFNQSLKAMGYKKIAKCKKRIKYDLDYINTTIDMFALIDLLKADSHARICLYGPPGTGKTGFATFVSEQLKIPLLIKRASDLLGPYVGQTEANIALAFEEANDKQEVLLIDEADSFLRKRSHAEHSWQITQVNEFLTQMENYEGILFCTTNLMDDLDEASLRRFDLKIDLNYLSKEQSWQLFSQEIKKYGSKLNSKQAERVRQKLDAIDYLTPGDFATIRRSNKLFKEPMTPEKLLQRLKEETSHKSVNKKSHGIGFISGSLSE